jgi:hypothetical protein
MSPADPLNNAPSAPPGVDAWRVLLRMLAAFFVVFAFAYWSAAGWNRGWTKSKLPIKQIDEVTGIEFITYKDHFMPGVELLSLALFFSLVLFSITFIRRQSRPPFPPSHTP